MCLRDEPHATSLSPKAALLPHFKEDCIKTIAGRGVCIEGGITLAEALWWFEKGTCWSDCLAGMYEISFLCSPKPNDINFYYPE